MPSKYTIPIAIGGLVLLIILAFDLYRKSKVMYNYNPNLPPQGYLYVPRYHGSEY